MVVPQWGYYIDAEKNDDIDNAEDDGAAAVFRAQIPNHG